MPNSISLEWIQAYNNKLLQLAEMMPEGPMRETQLLRVDYILDMVKSWKEQHHSN
jgi:hypothetical protein